MKLLTIAAICGASLTSGAANAATNLVTNGSFEQFDAQHPFIVYTDDTARYFPGSTDILGWTVTAGTDVALTGPTNSYGDYASDGDYSMELTGYADSDPYGGVSQSIATVAGAHYRLTFDLGNNSRYVNEDFGAAVLASAGGTSQTFTSFTYNHQAGLEAWETETLDFIAAGGSTLITLHGAHSGGYQAAIGLDNVSVVQTTAPTSGVPEPASWGLMLGGFGMVGGALRRSKRAAISFG